MAESGLGAMPPLGFGTYGRTGRAGEAAILGALEAGYRHLDTAQTYGTEGEVGRALRASGLPRGEVWVTTKVRQENLSGGRLIPSLEASLEAMGLDTVDLALIHWPARRGGPEPEDYLPDLAEARDRGLCRFMGVSNFPLALVDRALAVVGAGEILTNQVEVNPWFRNRTLTDGCAARGVGITCYQPIAQGRLREDPVLRRIGEAHGAPPERVALAWELAMGWAAIPTSGHPERIESNLAARDLRLSAEEMAEIDRLDRGRRAIDMAGGPDWD